MSDLERAKALFLSRASGDMDHVENTKSYVGALVRLGHVRQGDDGVVIGVASDGVEVRLGHVLARSREQERTDWARLGDYLARCPSPSDW